MNRDTHSAPAFTSVRIQTGARLHFGPFSYLPARGRHFGGVGLMIERPGVDLTVTTPSRRTRAGIASPRAEAMLETLLTHHPEWNRPLQMDLAEEIPAHSGLGSGTQLGLSMTEAILLLHGQTVATTELARLSGRGDRSAIGLFGYEQGGFLVDAGHAPGESLGTLSAREPFPAEWRILLLHPADAKGLHGSVEMQAFHQLGSMPECSTGRLCQLALTELLPALKERNFPAFAKALYEYGQIVGEFFKTTQGGVFASPQMRRLNQLFPKVEETGMTQSSWGPTVAMFASSDAQADQLRRRLWSALSDRTCRVEVTRARNFGRTLQTEPQPIHETRAGSNRSASETM